MLDLPTLDAEYGNYLRLEEFPSTRPSPLPERALMMKSPIRSTVVLPGESLVLVLENAAALRFVEQSPWVLLEDLRCCGRGTLAKVECRAYALSQRVDDANDPDVAWPDVMVVLQATNRVSFVIHDIQVDDEPHILLNHLIFDVRHLMRRAMRQNLTTSLDSRTLNHFTDEASVREALVDALIECGKTTLFPSGQRIDDPRLSLNEVLACARSLDCDHCREKTEEDDLKRIIKVVSDLHISDRLSDERVFCVCGRCVVTARSDLLLTRGAFHLNRYGYTTRLMMTKECDFERNEDMELASVPSTSDSWFRGYGWTSHECQVCHIHIGWKFHHTNCADTVVGLMGDHVLLL